MNIEHLANMVRDACRDSAAAGWATDPIWDAPTHDGVAIYQKWTAEQARAYGDDDGRYARVYAAMSALRFALFLERR